MSLVVTEAAETTNLTTLERVKSDLSITNNADDQRIIDAIGAASDDISAYIGIRAADDGSRTIGRETLTETLYIANPTWDLLLGRGPIVSVDTITENGVELDEAGYQINSAAGIIYRLNAIDRCCWTPPTVVAVTYTAGWLLPGNSGRNLPRDIEAAAISMVRDRFYNSQRRPGIQSETIFDVRSVTYDNSAINEGGMSSEIASRLWRYRRLTV